jgi:hypothetical protein
MEQDSQELKTGWGYFATVGTIAAVGYTREAVVAKKSVDLSVRQGEILDHVEN